MLITAFVFNTYLHVFRIFYRKTALQELDNNMKGYQRSVTVYPLQCVRYCILIIALGHQ